MRWKFHAAIVTVITILILVMYNLFKPAPVIVAVPEEEKTSNLRVEAATWGRNCNELYPIYNRRAQELAKTQETPPKEQKSPPVMIAPNNVLELVKKLCDGKAHCEFNVNADVLGDIFSDCSKEFEVSWRCFSYDKLRTETIQNGDPFKIDCDSN